MQQAQEAAYTTDYDYRAGSPHLKHERLHEHLVGRLRDVLNQTVARGLQPTLLEIGAGDGAFTEPVLAHGFRVTATEMARPSILRLERKFGSNPNFTVQFVDEDAPYPITSGKFSVILFVSVLHHIPDYIDVIKQITTHHLEPGGTLVTFQDPLWYPSLPRGTRLLSDTAYLLWRLPRGNYRRGFQTRFNRLRGNYDAIHTAEYHVARQGIDHEGLVRFISNQFDSVDILPYWSTQSGFWQRVGNRIGTKNTFGIVASGYRAGIKPQTLSSAQTTGGNGSATGAHVASQEADRFGNKLAVQATRT